MAKTKSKAKRTVGLSHHALEEEKKRKRKVPARGTAKGRQGPAHSAGTRRRSPASPPSKEARRDRTATRYARKSTKGGKTSGSRATLRAGTRKG